MIRQAVFWLNGGDVDGPSFEASCWRVSWLLFGVLGGALALLALLVYSVH